ncbi:uncharacterized protein RCC_08723 [Ramularia collo-cygni]|uniref:F-box domain-containing protein n=1 Tax=Ramularia collo-cygni TaxID=112498 RepID=A0A2D3V4U6_9PEZI|nr:uncharacterized protein RCC_08723 [Ramularia collo-cygni]CZT23013.1 uncharacterized protein RCC_08723 [Ramularia collo-cygni]
MAPTSKRKRKRAENTSSQSSTAKLTKRGARIITTRTATQVSAPEQVFNTTEMLEAILLHVDRKELTVTRGVCRRWKAVIDLSPSLQTVVLTRPVARIPTVPSLALAADSQTPPRYDKLTVSPLINYHHLVEGSDSAIRIPTGHNLHGFLKTALIPYNRETRMHLLVDITYFIQGGFPHPSNDSSAPFWQKMSFANPPITSTHLRTSFDNYGDEGYTNSVSVWNPKGVTWEDVLQHRKSLAEQDGPSDLVIVELQTMIYVMDVPLVWAMHWCDGSKDRDGKCACVAAITGRRMKDNTPYSAETGRLMLG